MKNQTMADEKNAFGDGKKDANIRKLPVLRYWELSLIALSLSIDVQVRHLAECFLQHHGIHYRFYPRG